MSLATPEDDIEPRLGRELTESEAAIVAIRLDDAERLLRHRIPDLLAKVAADEIDEGDVRYIEAEAVLRLIRNQDGIQSESDGNYSYQLNYQVASGKLTIEDPEWRILGITSGITVIRPVAAWTPCTAEGELNPQHSFSPLPFPPHPAVWWGENA